jgi:2-C-methyl-D-erythritol 4-phosphate cytidylyltransferase
MNVAIITAAGKGTRLKGNISKQFMNIYGKPILAHTISAFQRSSKIKEIYISVPKDHIKSCRKNIIEKYAFDKVKRLVAGGSSRQESVYNALVEVPPSTKIVSIHDGVRPLVTPEEINLLINTLVRENKKNSSIKGVIMAAPARETVKMISESSIDKTISRDKIWHAQTPQVFFYDIILKAHTKARKDDFTGTDDACLVERMNYKINIVRGRHENIKITTPIDLFLAELIITKNNRK